MDINKIYVAALYPTGVVIGLFIIYASYSRAKKEGLLSIIEIHTLYMWGLFNLSKRVVIAWTLSYVMFFGLILARFWPG